MKSRKMSEHVTLEIQFMYGGLWIFYNLSQRKAFNHCGILLLHV